MIARSDRTAGRFVDWALIGTVVFASVPQAFTLNMRVGGIPVMNGWLLLTALAVAYSYLLNYRGSRKVVLAYVAAGLYLCIVTMLYWGGSMYDARAAMQDAFCYAALPIGIALAELKSKSAFQDLLRKCYYAVSLTFAASLFLLLRGYVESRGGEERQLDGAMFTSTFIIAMFFPFLWSRARTNARTQKLLALSGMGLSVFFAIISATRSVFITIVIALVCTAIVEIKRDIRNLLWMGAGIVVLIAAAGTGRTPGLSALENSTLGARLTSTDYENEVRFEELTMMLDQMGLPEWLHGAGFGSMFDSPIGDVGVATVPHIGITTMLYKGGAPALVLLVLGPCLISVFGLVFFRSPVRDPFLAGVAIYLAQSCLSGGWSFIPLLFLGAFLRLGLERGEKSGAPRVIYLTRVPATPSLVESSR